MQEKRISTIHISEKSFLTGSKDKLVRDIVNMQEKGLELISKLHISEKSYLNESKDKLVRSFMNMEEKGLELISKGKMAIVLLLNEKEKEECVYDPDVVENEATETSTLPVFQNLLCDHEKFFKVVIFCFYFCFCYKMIYLKLICEVLFGQVSFGSD